MVKAVQVPTHIVRRDLTSQPRRLLLGGAAGAVVLGGVGSTAAWKLTGIGRHVRASGGTAAVAGALAGVAIAASIPVFDGPGDARRRPGMQVAAGATIGATVAAALGGGLLPSLSSMTPRAAALEIGLYGVVAGATITAGMIAIA